MVALREVCANATEALRKANIEDAAFELDQMLLAVSGRHRLQLEGLDETQYAQLQGMLTRRCQREPLQYILGNWDFLELQIAVGPGVLVPRAETEELCLLAAKHLQNDTKPLALDLCAGSGALALGLQSLCPNADIFAVELYEAAFSYLRQNCSDFAKNHLKAPKPVLADVCNYHAGLLPQQFSVIVSNPPYLSAAEYEQLEPELYFEPKQALVAEEDGLFFYRLIAQHYHRFLKSQGLLFFEIGATQAEAVHDILRTQGYRDIRLHHDLAGHPRVLQAAP